MVHPVEAGTRRWITLICLVFAVCILFGSTLMAARHLLMQDAAMQGPPTTTSSGTSATASDRPGETTVRSK
jgi:hypothetical protein